MNYNKPEIWKFSLCADDHAVTEIEASGARFQKFLHVGLDPRTRELCLWAEVLPDDRYKSEDIGDFCTIHVYGTGFPIELEEDDREYVGTAQQENFIWHVFVERGEDDLI